LPAALAADVDGAYTITNGAVTAYPRAGGTVSLANDYEIWDVAVDPTHVYWVARSGVKRIAKTGGSAELLARGTFRWCDIAVSDTDVYWGDAVLGTLFSVPKAGGPARVVAHVWDIATKDLAIDRGAVWVLQSEGTLQKIDPATGDVTSLAYALGARAVRAAG
jgi:hypothetical protein